VLGSFDFHQRPAPPLLLPPRACPNGATRAQFERYLPAALNQAVGHTLGLRMAEIERRHKSRTLAQIAAAQKVPVPALTKAMQDAVNQFAFSGEVQGFLTREQGTALQGAYARKIAALMQARPASPLVPPFGPPGTPAVLPVATPASP